MKEGTLPSPLVLRIRVEMDINKKILNVAHYYHLNGSLDATFNVKYLLHNVSVRDVQSTSHKFYKQRVL